MADIRRGFLLCESREVALDAAASYSYCFFVEFQTGDLSGLNQFQHKEVVHTQKVRHFLDGVERLDSGLRRAEAKLFIDVRLHQVGKVYVIFSAGEFDWGEAIRIGDVRVGAMSQKQFDHLGGTLVDGLVERRISAKHTVLALGRAILLIRVGAKFQEERGHIR